MFATLAVTALLALTPPVQAAPDADPIAAAERDLAAADVAYAARDFDAVRAALHSAFDHVAAAPGFDEAGGEAGDPIDRLLGAITQRSQEASDLALACTSGSALVRRIEPRGAGNDEVRAAWHCLGIALWQKGDLEAARERFERTIGAVESALGKDHPELVLPRQGLAVVLKDQGDLPAARALEEGVLARLESMKDADSRDVQIARRNLAVTLGRLGDDAGALALEEKVVAAFERTLDPADADLRSAQMNLAVTRYGRGDVDGALDLFRRVVLALEASGPDDAFDLQVARQNFAIALRVSGRLAESCALMEKVVAILERTRPEEDRQLLSARNNLGTMLNLLGRPAEACELQKKVLSVRERVLPADHRDIQFVRQNLAITLKSLGQLIEARRLEEEVLASYERTLPQDHDDVVSAQANLAATIADLGDAPGARILQERVLAQREGKLEDGDRRVIEARTNLATSLKCTGDVTRARALEESVVATLSATRPPDDPDLLLARGNLAVTMKLLGELDAAIVIEREIVAGRERIGRKDDAERLTARSNLAASLGASEDSSATGALAEATAIHEDVLAIRARRLPDDHPDLAMSRTNLAGVRLAAGNRDGARAVLADAVRGARASLRNALATSPREAGERVSGLSRLIDLCSRAFDRDDAAAQDALFALCETRRHVATAAPSCDRADDRELAALRFAAKSARERLAAAVARSAAEEDAAPRFADEVRARDEADAAMRRELLARGSFVGEVDAPAVARALAPDAAAVGYLAYGDGPSLLAWVVRPGSGVVRVELGTIREVEAAATAWRAAIDAPIDRGARPDRASDRESMERIAGDRLRALVLDPVLAAAGDVRVLHVCPDDVLHLVPLDALPLGEKERVGDRTRVVVETSFARLLAPRAAPAGEPCLLVVGDVAFDSAPDADAVADRAGRFTRLLQTRFEAEAVARLFAERFSKQAEALLGADATADAFAARVEGARYVHVATHGWIAADVDPMVEGLAPFALCGLAFAGANASETSGLRAPGIETAEELAALDFSACSILVLSACETNVGPRVAGLGIRSLMAAAHAAGARAAVTSLWRVDDAATRKLMEEFYGVLWKDEAGAPDVAGALWHAKRALLEAGHPPRDWAGFVLSGDPSAR